MEKLGLDYPRLAARNPGMVMVSGSVFGQTGPLAQELGRRWHRAALERPHAADRLAGSGSRDSERSALRRRHRAVSRWPRRVIAALDKRRRAGRGCHIDASMYELCVQQMRDGLRARRRRRRAQRQRGSRRCSIKAFTRPRARTA